MNMITAAVCIGCGCDDNHACYDLDREAGCYWLRIDRAEGNGVCSECEEHLEAWDRGDRTSHAESAELIDNPPRIPRPDQPRPPGIEPESGMCRVLTTGGISIRFAPKHDRCPHDWPFEDVQDSDRCRWCGMSFIHHLFAELP